MEIPKESLYLKIKGHQVNNIFIHSSMTFVLFGRNVCLFIHGIGIKRYKRLNKHHDESGTTSKHHGSSGRVAYNAYNVSDQIHVKFINYFAT